jgi:hypothetical membrane protein
MKLLSSLRTVFGASLGAWLWVSSLQYFLAQVITAWVWDTPYSLAQNYVSDLAATRCLIFGGQFVCSPWHALMNLSFVVLGLTMMLGAWLIPGYFNNERRLLIGFWCIGISGAGTLVVGFSPENVNLAVHQAGAFFPFVVGNIGMIVIGIALMKQKGRDWLSIYSITSGAVGFAAAILFSLKVFAGIGVGGMERVATYPLAIWMIVFGAACLANTSRRSKSLR